MNCSEFEAEVQRLVESRDSTLPDAAASHGQTCAACSRLWRDHRLVDAALVAWRPVEIPATLTESVMRRLADASGVNGPAGTDGVAVRVCSASAPSQWGALVAAAACLIVSVWFGLSARPINRTGDLTRNNSPSVEVGVIRRNASVLSPQPSLDVAESVVAVFDDLRGEYRELAEVTKATARDIAVVLPPTSPVSWMEDAASAGIVRSTTIGAEGLGDASSPGAVSQIGRSIGDQIGQAIEFLRVAVPASVPQG